MIVSAIWLILDFLGAKKWLVIGGAFLVLAAGSAIWIQTERLKVRALELAIAERDVGRLREVAEANAAVIRELQASAERQAAINQREISRANARATYFADLAGRIAARQLPNPPVGPGTQLLYDELRKPAGRQE